VTQGTTDDGSTTTVLAERVWVGRDDETFRIAVEAGPDGAVIVYTGGSTFLDPEVVLNEVIPWQGQCIATAWVHNAARTS
jgi:hypothetical protein